LSPDEVFKWTPPEGALVGELSVWKVIELAAEEMAFADLNHHTRTRQEWQFSSGINSIVH
jgi:hypothetical protein